MIIERQASFLFSSDPEAGAQALTKDKDSFVAVLSEPISVPKEALYCSVELINAVVVNVMPNVSEEIGNNKLSFTEKGILYSLVFPDGLYGLADINAWLSREFVNNSLPDDLFVFTGDDATQRVVLTFNYADTVVLFSVPGSINTLLGFNSQDYPPVGTSAPGDSFTSEETANINRITSWLIHCDIAPRGIPTNAIMSNIIAQIPIPAGSIGKTVGYSPFNPVRVETEHLIGHPVNAVSCRLSDQLGRTVDTLGEPWSFLMTLRWGMQVGSDAPRDREHQNARTYRKM